MDLYTLAHVVISLIGIGSGFVVVFGMLNAAPLDGWTAVFLATTAATSLTGFFFPFHGFKPSYVVGAISLVVLALAAAAKYKYGLAGGWRLTYVVTAVIAFYLNVFVLIVQSFLKVPALNALAPTQTEGPFKAVQAVVLVLFIALGVAAAKIFRVP